MRHIAAGGFESFEVLCFVGCEVGRHTDVEGACKMKITWYIVLLDKLVDALEDKSFVGDDFQSLDWTVERGVVLASSESICEYQISR